VDNRYCTVYCHVMSSIDTVVSYTTGMKTQENVHFVIGRPTLHTVGRIAQSVYRLATGWTVWGSNHGGGEIFRACPDRPWGPSSLLYNGYRVFTGGKRAAGS